MSASRRVALSALKVAARAADVVRRPQEGTVFLLYHRVDDGPGTQAQLDIPTFDRQMAVVAGHHLQTLDEFLVRRPGGDGAARSVVVTFDDGTADFVDNALPILVRHAVPATLYLATEFVESQRPFPDGGRPLSWAALADAVATGLVAVGSHTHTHRLLDRVPPATAAEELDRSKALIEDRLGIAADHFAYPKALLATPAVETEVRARFKSAALGGGRANRPGITDPHRLSRTAIQAADGMRWFHRKLGGGMVLEGAMRQALNRRRYVRATS